MPRQSSKASESISARQRRSSRVTLPAAQTTTSTSIHASASASASPAPSSSTSIPPANAKNIDDINWRHPAELELIHPEASSQADIIPILQSQAFSVPPHPTDPNERFCTITLGLGMDTEKVQVVIPLGYRIPLLFCGKYLWESVRLVLTSIDPPPDKEWEQYKYDLLNLSRLCYTFLQSALVVMKRKGKGMTQRWRNQTFDRVLTRYWWGWMVNREEFIRMFWFEFKEEEYERDVCRRDWKAMALKGHNGFQLTESEITNGITAEQFTAGLLSLPPQLSPSPSGGMIYKWDNTLYALANELVITGSRVGERRDSEEEVQGDWEGEEGRSRKRMKIDVDPADAEGEAFNLVRGGVDRDGDVEMQDAIVVGEVVASPEEAFPEKFPTSNCAAAIATASDSTVNSARTGSAVSGAVSAPSTTRELSLVPVASSSMPPSPSAVPSSILASLPNDFHHSNRVVINQVLNIVPGMLSQLRTIMEVARSEKTLLSPSADNPIKEAALEKMQSTTAALESTSSSSSSSVSVDLMNALVERIKALESDIKSNRERRAKENDEWNRMQTKLGELEGRMRGYHVPSSTSRNGGVNGSYGVPERYRTPVSRTNSVDDSCPLPVKSKRKHMSLIATLSETPRPS